ncbi:Glycosyltransferase family 10 (fucosyltransferase) C-term [Lachnospiraceae bacterium NLAE-zl-G231]|nr:Glycosyltransferase family 10 (fucosyltransferase) C-term [Lachnospiraceae bacterium NLAE-zl-G231]
MKEIKVKFVDYWDDHHLEKDIIYKILKKHYQVKIVEDPDYLFYSVFSDDNLKYDCIKIFYTAENICPDFNLCDYAIGFEELQFSDRYIRIPNFVKYLSDIELMKNKNKDIINDEDFLNRKFCSFIYSNGNADIKREKLFYEISKYKKINSAGRYLNNVGKVIEDKIDYEKNFKFSIACENCSHMGYSTEKIVQSFAAKTVPIYWGDPDIDKVFNPKSFINLMKFSDFNEAIQYIKNVDANGSLYLNMLREPALLDPTYCDKKYMELESFLVNIIEQPKDEAYRRCNIARMGEYQRKMEEWRNIYLMRKYKEEHNIVNKIVNLSKTFLDKFLVN